ncbi:MULTISPECIES: hypothetical protein [Ferrimicrobium]|nr:hypothetical protein [Ferrimicrobium sp.]
MTVILERLALMKISSTTSTDNFVGATRHHQSTLWSPGSTDSTPLVSGGITMVFSMRQTARDLVISDVVSLFFAEPMLD